MEGTSRKIRSVVMLIIGVSMITLFYGFNQTSVPSWIVGGTHNMVQQKMSSPSTKSIGRWKHANEAHKGPPKATLDRLSGLAKQPQNHNNINPLPLTGPFDKYKQGSRIAMDVGMKVNDPSLNKWLQEQKRRVSESEAACEAGNKKDTPARKHNILVDDRNKMLFCYVPKAGCTTWKNIVSSMAKGQTTFHVNPKIHRGKGTGYHRLQNGEFTLKANYTKVLFVRDPYERIVSLYRVCREHPFRGLKHNSTFTQFISYVLGNGPNEHYDTYQRLCEPCNCHYDFIGKHETFNQDAVNVIRIILNKTTTEAYSWVPMLNANKGKRSSLVTYELFESVPKALLAKFEKKYSDDLKMFGYKPINARVMTANV